MSNVNAAVLPFTARSESGFYPTPEGLAGKMLAGLKWQEIETILDPSAGKGDLVRYAMQTYKNRTGRFGFNLDIDCVEIDRNLQHILRGEDFKVVHDDFLTYKAVKKYDLILMNPPFADGDKHLLKALEMQKNGGRIICLLNAETLQYPYTNTRKLLVQMLGRYGAEISYLENEFTHAERITNVTVALVRVNIPCKKQESEFFSRMKKAEEMKESCAKPNELTDIDFLKAIVSQYNVEVSASVALIKEYEAMRPYITESGGSSEILTLAINGSGRYTEIFSINNYLRKVRLKYWRRLFSNREFTQRMTSNLQRKYHDNVEKMADYDFTMFNIRAIVTEMNSELVKGVEDTVMALFNRLSEEHSWYPESAKNVHYWNGWASNKAHKVNRKVIIPANGMFCNYSWRKGEFEMYKALELLEDIEKALNYLDGGLTVEVDLRKALEMTSSGGQTKNIACKYFDVDFYKKGTAHIKFTNHALLDKLNIYAARNRNWLPPNYGRTKYGDMDAESKKAIDEFQGEAEYEKVVKNNDYYLFEVPGVLPLLTGNV